MGKTDFQGADNFNLKSVINSYNRFVPDQILDLLGKEDIRDVRLGDQIEKIVTILFSDIRNFTSITESLTPKESFNFLNSYLTQMETVIRKHNGIIDKFIGDTIMVIFPDNTDNALSCSLQMMTQLKHFNENRAQSGSSPIAAGIGLNTGLCMLGAVGGESRIDFTVIGDAVNISSRLESLTKKYGVSLLISENTFNSISDIYRHHIRFIDRVLVKGKLQAVSVYEVFENDPIAIRKLKKDTRPLFEEALAHYHYKKIEQAKELLEECIRINPADLPAKVYLERCDAYTQYGTYEGAQELSIQLEWCSDFEVGNKEIDKQHYELFANSIKLLQLINKEEVRSEIDNIINFIEAYINIHFKTEEAYLEAHKYPFIEHQKMQHINFKKSFELLKMELKVFNMSKIYLMFRIQILLIDWIVNHTLKEDKHYSKHIRSKGLI